MKKIILVAIAVLFGIVTVGSLFFTYVPKELTHVQNPIELPPNEEPPTFDQEILDGIAEINEKNSKILHLSSRKVDVVIQQGIGIRLRGEIYYEKNKRFRLKIQRKFRNILEADIGSNNSVFWFWSRQMEPCALYYAKHEDTLKTRLKTAFHPTSMMESLGIGEIDIKDADISEFEGKWKVTKRRMTSGGAVLHSTVIDPAKQRIVGSYITTLSGRMIASSEILNWQNGLPQTIVFNWHEENTILQLKLNDPVKNVRPNESLWNMPNITPKIDMATD